MKLWSSEGEAKCQTNDDLQHTACQCFYDKIDKMQPSEQLIGSDFPELISQIVGLFLSRPALLEQARFFIDHMESMRSELCDECIQVLKT